jgi:serine/threonine-protein phosphatase 6 regulatory ankyrin repeat subunit B
MAYTELDIKNKLFGAARTNNLADIKKLVGYISPDVKDATGRSALFGAAYFGFKDSIKLLLEQDADVNMADFEGCTPLHYACQQGNSDAVNSLCLGGALTTLVDIEGRSPAYVAALASKLACVRALVAHNGFLDAPPDNKNCAPLFAALAIDDNPELVKLLVEGGAKVDVQDGDGHTPLHHAAAKGRLEAAKVCDIRIGFFYEFSYPNRVLVLILYAYSVA